MLRRFPRRRRGNLAIRSGEEDTGLGLPPPPSRLKPSDRGRLSGLTRALHAWADENTRRETAISGDVDRALRAVGLSQTKFALPTFADVTRAAQSFLDPVLARELDAAWNPKTWSWDRR